MSSREQDGRCQHASLVAPLNEQTSNSTFPKETQAGRDPASGQGLKEGGPPQDAQWGTLCLLRPE